MRFSVEALLSLVVVAVLVREARVQAATVHVTIGRLPVVWRTDEWDGACDAAKCTSTNPCVFDPYDGNSNITVSSLDGKGCKVNVVSGANQPTPSMAKKRYWNVDASIPLFELHFMVGMGPKMLFAILTPMSITAAQGIALSGVMAVDLLNSTAKLKISGTTITNSLFYIYPYARTNYWIQDLVVVESTTIEQTIANPIFQVSPPFESRTAQDPSSLWPVLYLKSCTLKISGSAGFLNVDQEIPNFWLRLEDVTTPPSSPLASPLMISHSTESGGDTILHILGTSNITSTASSLISTARSSGASIEIFNQAIVSNDFLSAPTVCDSQCSLFAYDKSKIQGFVLSNVAITLGGSAAISNCDLSISDTTIATLALFPSSEPSIVFDASLPSFRPGWVFYVQSAQRKLTFQKGAVLNLPSHPLIQTPSSLPTVPYIFSGDNSIGSSQSAGQCTVKAYTISSQDPTNIASFCNLVITGGLSALFSPSLNGDGTRVGSVATTGLELHAVATHDAIIDLSTWNLFSVAIDPHEQLTTPAIRGSTTESLQIANRPQSIRVIWPSDSLEEPRQNVDYLLFDTIIPTAQTFETQSHTTSEDRYQFTIAFTPPKGSSNMMRVVARYVSPNGLPPQPTAPTPSSLFQCSNRQCTSNTSISQPVVILPPNSNTVIDGNLTATTLIFDGLGSSISVKGCISSDLSYITLELSAEDLKKLQSSKDQSTSSPLVHVDPAGQSSSSCESSVRLDDINVSVKVKDGGCKKVKFSRKTSADGLTLSAILTLDNSKCNLWWIILSSVLGGVVLIAIVVVVLLVSLVPSIRHKIRPYSKKRVAN